VDAALPSFAHRPLRELPDDLIGQIASGEASTASAPAAVVNAINDPLRPLKAECWSHPVTPEKIPQVLGHI